MTSLFPRALQDKSNLALEKVMNEIFKFDLKPLMFLFIDHCDERLLKILAKSFHESLSEKRNLIKNAILIHRYKGTKAALKRVLNVLNVTGEIKEWFEYEGRPMYFKVLLEVFDRPLTLETELKLIKLINEFKNVRSKLEIIEIYLTQKAKMHTYCHITSGLTISISVRIFGRAPRERSEPSP